MKNYSLLPFVEQSSLYSMASYGSSPAARDTALRQRLTTAVPIYNCPSRRGGDLLQHSPTFTTAVLAEGTDER